MYPSDNVQASSRRESHFPRVADVTFGQQQSRSGSIVAEPSRHAHNDASSRQEPGVQKQVDARPMNLLALDPSFYSTSSHSTNCQPPAYNLPGSAGTPAGAMLAQVTKTETHPLGQVTAAVALSA